MNHNGFGEDRSRRRREDIKFIVVFVVTIGVLIGLIVLSIVE